VIVRGAVRSREYERDGAKHRIVEVRADTIGRLDRTERRSDGDPDAREVSRGADPPPLALGPHLLASRAFARTTSIALRRCNLI
jgi:hypothetical protein